MGSPDLALLEPIAREVALEWGIELGAPLPGARYSFVAPAGPRAILKVTPREDDEADEEGDALVLWAGHGAVRLIRRDRARRALLLERAQPGTDISGLSESAAVEAAIGVGRRLWRPAGEPFRWIGDHVPRWLDEAERTATSGHQLLALARDLYQSLSVGRSLLVHGDFHHHNILLAGRHYVAIDPKPMLGEPEYDVPTFLWNPRLSRMTQGTTERRLAGFAAAGLDDGKMRAWSVIRGAYLGADEDEAAILRALIK